MPKQTLTHDCPHAGRTTLTARWLKAAEALRAKCEDCESAVYANKSGAEEYAVGLTMP